MLLLLLPLLLLAGTQSIPLSYIPFLPTPPQHTHPPPLRKLRVMMNWDFLFVSRKSQHCIIANK